MTLDSRLSTHSFPPSAQNLPLMSQNFPAFARHDLSKHLLPQHETKSSRRKTREVLELKTVFSMKVQNIKTAQKP